jgi:mono/diheme cytochrome c family protein
VLVERCYACHSASAEKLKSGLRLDTSQGIFRGGESGAPAVVPGKPGDSLLISAIHYREGGLQMPPKGKLPDQQIADIVAYLQTLK